MHYRRMREDRQPQMGERWGVNYCDVGRGYSRSRGANSRVNVDIGRAFTMGAWRLTFGNSDDRYRRLR